MLILVIILIQLLGLYIAYKSKSELHWYAIIIFLPTIGTIIYIFWELKNNQRLNKFRKSLFKNLQPKKHFLKIEKKFLEEDSFINTIDLAEAYEDKNAYKEALQLYEKALITKNTTDPYTIKKIIKCNYSLNDFDAVIHYYNRISKFKNHAETIFYYGISLEKKGELKNAEKELKKVNVKFTNYNYRLELSKFLLRANKNFEAKNILDEIIVEIENMLKRNQKKYKPVYLEAKALTIKK